MSSLNKTTPGARQAQDGYWRSLAELENRPEIAEFLHRAAPPDLWDSALSRRRFVQLMGASIAFAGAMGSAGCRRWEKDEIVPLARRSEGYIPGVLRHYNTAWELGGAAMGLRVASYDGRPIKIEGNELHPYTGGATTAQAQATILELYDPDRSGQVIANGAASSFANFAALAKGLARDSKLAVLAESTSSPTVRALREELATQFPNSQWREYEPLSRDNERQGMRVAFGQPLRPLARLDHATTIVALDGDFLVDHPASLRYARDFARGRRPEGNTAADAPTMNRLYAIESTFTNTGAIADHRLPLRSELILPFVMALEAKVLGQSAPPQAAFLQETKVAAFLEALAKDLRRNARRSLLIVGSRQPPEVHALVARINSGLGAVGRTVDYVADPDLERPIHAEAIAALVAEMNGGRVDHLLILGGNPVFDAPADLGFAQALGRVKTSIHLSPFADETSALCTWHLPRAHFLESWGDARSWDGTIAIVQPLIEPLRGGKTAIEVLAVLLGKAATGRDLVRATFERNRAATGPSWERALHDGYVAGSALAPAQPALRPLPPARLSARQRGGTELKGGELEVVFTSSSHVYDGRFANNGWLQETPDPLTKVTWDNAALISPATAAALGLANDTLVRVTVGEREVVLPLYVMPGQAPYSLALAVGHGRTRAGHVGGLIEEGVASAGFNVYPLRTAKTLYLAQGAQVSATGQAYRLANVQDHWAMDQLGQKQIQKRMVELVRTTTLEAYRDPDFHFTVHGPPLESLFDPHETLTEGGRTRRWGMATDLSTCIACNACMVACQAENNVPIVGRKQVKRSREMHWIRLDRYFAGDPDDPKAVHQPVTCQQCEKAPCEQVCPVGATVHTTEGLNDMVYNRCVGTRYCLNNCPYKVRRFNYYAWHGDEGAANENLKEERNKIRKLLFNPEVTVRSRGVMEKCSFCVQRIHRTTIQARNEGRAVQDGEIRTACMQACPTDAIVFGDLSDPESRVSKLHNRNTYKRGYFLLAELNTHPRNTYLARVRNPNSDLG